MINRKKHFIGLLRTVLFVMLLSMALGCSKPGSEIVGTWDNVKVPEVVEFKTGGTGTISYPNNQNPPLTFAWKQTGNSFNLDVNYMGTKKTLTGTLKDKTLVLESTIGKEVYNKRLPGSNK